VLVLDDLRHSYVDLEDPRRLEFPYVRWIGDLVDARRPARAVFLGGGGFTLPRYLAAVRPGARSVVLEIDGELVGLVRDELGLRESPALRVRVGDARVSLRDEPTGSADLVVGDAFGGLAVPWHLATVQFLRDVRRVLRPDGVYSANLIDFGPLAFARAEAATLRRVFPHVALVTERGGRPGGNLVLHASERPLPLGALARRRGTRVLDGAQVARFARGAPVLTDDSAPADQLLTPTR
jgi:spermidine synthase